MTFNSICCSSCYCYWPLLVADALLVFTELHRDQLQQLDIWHIIN